MAFIGLITAFIATICWAISVFPFTKAGRAMSVESLNLFRLILGTMLIFIVAVIMDKQFFSIFSDTYIQGWFWLGVSGIVALGIGDYFGLKMYAILSPRYGSILTTMSPAMALLAGIILLNEQINFTGIAGMCITIIGVLVISLGRSERNSIPDHGYGSVKKGIMFGFISAACNGAALAMSKKGFIMQQDVHHHIHPLTGSFIRFFIAVGFVLLFMLLQKKLVPNLKNITAQPLNIIKIATTGVIFGPLLAVSLAMVAIQSINVAVAQTVFALVPVVVLLISYFVYKEQISNKALYGVLAAIAGVTILIWRVQIQYYIMG